MLEWIDQVHEKIARPAIPAAVPKPTHGVKRLALLRPAD
jgi:hypothetical protein